MKPNPKRDKAGRQPGSVGKTNGNQQPNTTPTTSADQLFELKRKYLTDLLNQFGGNSAENQRQRIVESLARFSLTTPEIRKYLDVMEVAARIWELRHVFGHAIDKTMVDDRTDLGRKHKVALYTLTNYVVRTVPTGQEGRAA